MGRVGPPSSAGTGDSPKMSPVTARCLPSRPPPPIPPRQQTAVQSMSPSASPQLAKRALRKLLLNNMTYENGDVLLRERISGLQCHSSADSSPAEGSPSVNVKCLFARICVTLI
jgi:hypothetical protein